MGGSWSSQQAAAEARCKALVDACLAAHRAEMQEWHAAQQARFQEWHAAQNALSVAKLRRHSDTRMHALRRDLSRPGLRPRPAD